MVGIFLKPGFFAREFLEMAFGGLRPALLQALTQAVMPLTVVLNSLTAKRFTLAIGGKVHDTKINAQSARHFVGGRCRNFQRHRQIERPIPIEQVSLSLDRVQTGLLISTETEGEKHTARDRQEGHGVNALKVHNTLIIDDGTLWPECGFDARIALVGFTGLADTADGQLSGKLIGGTQFTIYHLLQFKLVRCLGSPRYRSYIGSSLIECMHGLKQCLSLF